MKEMQIQGVRERMLKGASAAAEAIGVTLGPGGRLVSLQRKWGGPHVTKDGVTVANEIVMEDPYENMGAQLVIEASRRCNREAGDGTTTVAVLAQAMMEIGLRETDMHRRNPSLVALGMRSAAEQATKLLGQRARRTETLEQIKRIATLAANGDTEIADMIAECVDKVGRNGVVQIVDGLGHQTGHEIVSGSRYERGSVFRIWESLETQSLTLQDAKVLCYAGSIPEHRDALKSIGEAIVRAGRPVLVVADRFEDLVKATFFSNASKGIIKVILMQSPGVGEQRRNWLEDIAVLTGGEVIDPSLQVEWNPEWLVAKMGSAEIVTSNADTTTVIGGGGSDEAIKSHVDRLVAEQNDPTKTEYNREKLQERLAALTGGIAKVSIGGNSETALKERRDRADDALCACQAAIEEGVVEGCGSAMYRVVADISGALVGEDIAAGIRIVKNALKRPMEQILRNAHGTGGEAAVRIQEWLSAPDGSAWDVVADDLIENAIEQGLIVPMKVERLAIRSAVEAAVMLLSIEAAVVEMPDKD